MNPVRKTVRHLILGAAWLLAVTLPTGLTSAATILIEVDVSNLSKVTLTSTGEHALRNDSSARIRAGVTLNNFFASDFDVDDVAFDGVYNELDPEPLCPARTSTDYSNFDNGFGGVGLRDINLYQFGFFGGPRQRFKKTKPPLRARVTLISRISTETGTTRLCLPTATSVISPSATRLTAPARSSASSRSSAAHWSPAPRPPWAGWRC